MQSPLLRVQGSGSVNLPDGTVDYRLEPKLVASTEGQGGAANVGGIEVRLPEAGVAAALETLDALDRKKNLITRDIVLIDLRLPNRVTVRLSDAAAQARTDALKEQPKKKAGDA